MSAIKQPIRLTVDYKTPEGLLQEFTRSVGRGGVTIEARRSIPVGTRFVFEMRAHGQNERVEVAGEVVQVTPGQGGKFLLSVRYDELGDRKSVEQLISRIFEAHKFEKVRRYPRVPIQLRATEDVPYSPSYLVRDIGRGGVGIEVEAPTVPKKIRVGAPFLLEVWLSLGSLVLHGEVLWVFTPPVERSKWLNPSFGVSFGKLRPESEERLDKILTLRGLPPPPWKARISIGTDAVSRMP